MGINLPAIPGTPLNKRSRIAGERGDVPELEAPEANLSNSLDPKPEPGDDLGQYQEAVERAKKRFEYVNDKESENRRHQKEDTKFAWEHGEQWNEGNRRARETAIPPRPWLEFNQTGPYIKRITNEQRQNKPQIEVRPVGGGAKKETADIYSGLVRSIEYCSAAGSIYDNAIEQAVTGGAGYYRIITRYEAEDSFNQCIEMMPVPNALAVYLDPDAQAPDKGDAKYGFVCEWLDRETFEQEWGDKGDVSWEADDGSIDAGWYNGDLVCVADYYEVIEEDQDLLLLSDHSVMWADAYNDKYMQGPWGGVGPLPTPAPLLLSQDPAQAMPVPGSPPTVPSNGTAAPLGASPLDPFAMLPPQILKREPRKRSRVDFYKMTAQDKPLAKYKWAGKYVPIVMVPGDEIDIDGKRVRQGIIRRLRDAQMMYNYWFTLATERIALAPKAPFIGISGQFEGHPEWDDMNTENHPYLEFEAVTTEGGTEVISPPQRTDAIGIDAGLVTMLQLCSQNLRDITGQKDSATPNPNVPWRAILAEQRKGDLATFHYGDNLARAIALGGKIIVDLIPHIYDTQRALRIIDEDGKTEQQVMVNQRMPGQPPTNDLTVGDYDVVVTVGPAYATRRIEAANEMKDFLDAMGEDKAALIGDLFAKMTDWPNGVGDQIAARLFAMLPPQIQQMEQSGQDPVVAQLQGAMKNQAQQAQQQMQQVMQKLQELTQENQKLQSEVYQERANSAKVSLQAIQRVAASDRSLQVQQLESRDTMVHTAMDAKQLAADIKSGQVEDVITFLAKVVVPLLVAQQKQQAPVGPEATQIAGEVHSGVPA